jgi:hypothetical protein
LIPPKTLATWFATTYPQLVQGEDKAEQVCTVVRWEHAWPVYNKPTNFSTMTYPLAKEYSRDEWRFCGFWTSRDGVFSQKCSSWLMAMPAPERFLSRRACRTSPN